MKEKISAILDNRDNAFRVLFIIVALFGLMMTFAIPPWQTPDELAHVSQIGYFTGNPSLGETLMNDMELDFNKVIFNSEGRIDAVKYMQAMTAKPGYERRDVLPKSVSFYIIRYLPTAMGMFIGLLLGLPTFWVMELAELFSLAFYLFCFVLVYKLMPYKKEMILMIMALPMTLQQCASVNYDSVLLPLCFVFIAYVLNIIEEEKTVGIRQLMFMLFILIILYFIKLPYIMLGLLMLAIPAEQIRISIGKNELLLIDGKFLKKWKYLLMALVLAAVILVCFVMRNNLFFRIIGAMIIEWKRSIYLFAATARFWGKFLAISAVGKFGWIDSQLPGYVIIITYIMMLVMAVLKDSNDRDIKGNKRVKPCLLVSAAVMGILISIAMVNHTITVLKFGEETMELPYDIRQELYNIPYIGGLQGRYFIPCLVLVLLALPQFKKKVKGKLWLLALTEILLMAATAFVLVGRYFI